MKHISNRAMAQSWDLWREYIDPDATMTKAEFDEMTVEQRIGLIDGYIGAEFARIDGYARQVHSGFIWAIGSHEMQWSRRSTREACEQVVLEVVERMGIEAAFDDCRNGTIDFDDETNPDGVDTYHAWDCEGEQS